MLDPIRRELAGVALGVVPAFNESLRLRGAHWYNLVHTLGSHAPYFVTLDIGQLFAVLRTEASAPLGADLAALDVARPSPALRARLDAYRQLVADLARSEVVLRCQKWHLNDQVIAVLLTRILDPVFRAWSGDERASLTRVAMPLEAQTYSAGALRLPLDTEECAHFESFLDLLLAKELQVKHAVEQLDIDTLRLLGMFQGVVGVQTPLEMVDLLGLFTMPMVNDIVNFSLQIIPAVLEATRRRDAQVAAMDGFEGLERIGQLDNLMLTELVYDDDVFYQRFVDNELFYYARSRAREEERKVHYVVLDASASMRGRRSVFARGVALAMLKKLLLLGERPILRFFDSQLYEPVEVHGGFSVPYLLAFRSERGRNYTKVFERLLFEVRRLREERGQEVMLYILTHGQCHVPGELVRRLREVATLYGIFILPGAKLELDYVDLLHHHRVVGEEALQTATQRREAALDILQQI